MKTDVENSQPLEYRSQPMDINLDYLSVTVPISTLPEKYSQGVFDHLVASLKNFTNDQATFLLTEFQYYSRQGRGHYSNGLICEEHSLGVWFGGDTNHFLIEIGGAGCQMLRNTKRVGRVLDVLAFRATRVDIACDFKGADCVQEFAGSSTNKRWQITEWRDTASGKTAYVGSTDSERFVRVYKYNPPHPRSDTMRVEYVSRGKYAKAVLEVVRDHGWKQAAAALGSTFAWHHPLWTLEDATSGKIKVDRSQRHGANTLRWINGAVKSALIRAHREKLMDLQAWCDNLLAEIE